MANDSPSSLRQCPAGTPAATREAAGIDASIAKMERKAFVKMGVIPEIQALLAMPPDQAKEAFLGAMGQYTLVSMLLLASLLGSALSPLDANTFPQASPKLIAAFNVFSMLITCCSLLGTTTFVLEAIVVQATPLDKVHPVIAKADGVFVYAINTVAVGLQGTCPLILMRAWISLETLHCVVLTSVVGVLWLLQIFVFMGHLQDALPFMAQRWVKIFAPVLYQKEPSHAAVDEMVAELRYMRTEREKTLSPLQLSLGLDRYFSECKDMQLADEADFLQMLEGEVKGRLAPVAEQLAQQAFGQVVDEALQRLVDDALTSMKTTAANNTA